MRFPQILTRLSREVSFVTTQELEDMFPGLDGNARETAYVKEHHTACIMQIGGGIGQSRLAMLMLGCAHIGEVQSSVWDKETVDACAKAGISLL